MTNMLTQEEFSKHIGTQFSVGLGDREVNLTLAEVKGYRAGPTEQEGLERFSVFFDGPQDSLLPQQNFQMRHERMGEFDIFLVPIKDGEGFRYEAVFNYYRDKQ